MRHERLALCVEVRERDAKVLREGMMMEECGWIY